MLSATFSDNLVIVIFLLFLEVVLNVDNMVVIAMISSNVSKNIQKVVQAIGLFFALIFRIILLLFISALINFEKPILILNKLDFSLKDIMMLIGGIFLIYKSVSSIIDLKNQESKRSSIKKQTNSGIIKTIAQIAFIDCVFSLDSIVTAISVTQNITIISIVIVISVACMLIFSQYFIKWVEKYLAIKIMALLFIYFIGIDLLIESVDVHIDKYFLYLAMGIGVLINIIYFLCSKKNT